MSNNRRDFFKTLGTAAAGVAAATPLIKASNASGALTSKEPITFVHALALGESLVGQIRDFDGGDAVGFVVKEPVDEFGVVRKHIGQVKYEDVSLSCAANMAPAFYAWISSFLARDPSPINGAILSADANLKFRTQLNFIGALLTEVTFPELDASSKEPALMSVKFNPESTHVAAPSFSGLNPKGEKSPAWSSNNFRISIGGLTDETTRRVSRIEAITIKQKLVQAEIGEVRDPEMLVEPLDLGPIVLTVPENYARPFIDWHRDFVVQGNNGAVAETFVRLEYLSASGKEVLFTLSFSGVGIYRASRIGENAKKGAQRSVRVELYAETVNLFVGSQPTK